MATPQAQQQQLQQMRANQLAFSQAQYRQQQEAVAAAAAIKKPSAFGYAVLFALAGILDILDILELTGFGNFFTKLVQIPATIFFLGISFLVNRKIKRMKGASDILGPRIAEISRRIFQMRQRYARVLNVARRIKPLRQSTRAIALGIKKLRTTVGHNPFVKNVVANILEFIPFLGVIPFQLIGTYLMYKDHMKSYEEALEILKEFEETRLEEEQDFSEQQQLEYEELLRQQKEQDSVA